MIFSTEALSPGKIALIVEYDGSGFCGWQKQVKPPVPTVQETLEVAVSKVANEGIKVFCAGRTDARVHASAQLVHFESSVSRSQKAWICGVNANLPDSVVVVGACQVPDEFHARHSAEARTYRYIIANTPVRSANYAKKVTHISQPLNEGDMNSAAQALVGENDFSSFRGAACQSNSPFRFVEYVSVCRKGDLVIIEIKANAFVLHMVRNIAGALIEVGLSRKPVDWIGAVLKLKDRTQAAATGAPEGLYFVKAHYPCEFDLPECVLGPLFLQD